MPKTGRTHQLRVHLSLIKHPIAGDTMYGGKTVTLEQLANDQPLPGPGDIGNDLAPDEDLIIRQALQAAELEIDHPTTGQPVRFQAPLPPDLQRFVALLDRYRS